MNLIRVTKISGWLLALSGACLCLGAIWLAAAATLDFARHGNPDWSGWFAYSVFYGVIGAAALFGAGCAAVGVHWARLEGAQAQGQGRSILDFTKVVTVIVAVIVAGGFLIQATGASRVTVHWVLAAVPASLWLLVVVINAHGAWRSDPVKDQESPRTIPIVGAIFGLMAVAVAPIHSGALKWGLRAAVILLDYGCLVMLAFLGRAALKRFGKTDAH